VHEAAKSGYVGVVQLSVMFQATVSHDFRLSDINVQDNLRLSQQAYLKKRVSFQKDLELFNGSLYSFKHSFSFDFPSVHT
jgi:hypothetical protein